MCASPPHQLSARWHGPNKPVVVRPAACTGRDVAGVLRRYDSIAHNEISIQSQAGPGTGPNPLLWAELDLQAQTPRGTLLDVTGLSTPLSTSRSWLQPLQASC